jgi:hypothetical protein
LPDASVEREAVQWQYSYDNVNWYNAGLNSTSANFKAPPILNTTYYRRVSSHIEGSLGQRTYWYTSNVITYNIQGKTPMPPVSNYPLSICGSSGTTNLSVAAGTLGLTTDTSYPINKTYNWWVPYAGWAVSNDGSNPFSTYNAGSSFITRNANVVLTIPNNTTPGTYAINVSGNSDCGQKSPDATIYVTVASGTPAGAVSRIEAQLNSPYYECVYQYDIYTNIVPGVTSYTAEGTEGSTAVGIVQARYNQVYFPIGMQASAGHRVKIITANSCGETSTLSQPFYNEYGYSGCRLAQPSPVKASALDAIPAKSEAMENEAAYPNPAKTELILSAKGQEAEATLYDTRGAVQRVVHMRAVQNSVVNVLDLAPGLYHLRITTKDKVLLEKRIVIQH